MNSITIASALRTSDVHSCLVNQLLADWPTPARRQLLLHHDPLGRPWFRDKASGQESNLTLSFTHGRERSWAALGRCRRIGIDVATTEEFDAPYPFSRVFTPKELESALPHCAGHLPLAASLLWSIKEAAVKALGCGFSKYDYREIAAAHGRECDIGLVWQIEGQSAISVYTRREGSGWLALAWEGSF